VCEYVCLCARVFVRACMCVCKYTSRHRPNVCCCIQQYVHHTTFYCTKYSTKSCIWKAFPLPFVFSILIISYTNSSVTIRACTFTLYLHTCQPLQMRRSWRSAQKQAVWSVPEFIWHQTHWHGWHDLFCYTSHVLLSTCERALVR